MDTEVTRRRQMAPTSPTARPAEEFDGRHVVAPVEQSLQASPDHRQKSSAAVHARSLSEQFAGIVYFSEMAAGIQHDRGAALHRTGAGRSGADSERPTPGRRSAPRPWRLPAVGRRSKA